MTWAREILSARFVWLVTPALGVALPYAAYWYFAVPRDSYPSLRIAPNEELPLLLHATSAMSLLAVGSALLVAGLLWLGRRRGGRVAGLLAGLFFTLLLLPALSGRHDVLERHRPWFALGTGLALVTTWIAIFSWFDLRPEGRLRRLADPAWRRAALLVVAALAFASLCWATEPLNLYPALLLFLFTTAVLSCGLAIESSGLPAVGSRAHRWAVGISIAGIILSFASVTWVSHAQAFARVRYVFSRRCIGADGLVRLPASLRAEWLKVRSAFAPSGAASGRARPWPDGVPVPKQRPHVVLFVIDALRNDHVTAATAPNLTELATRGLRHERAYSASSGTAQSMVACLSGLPPGVLARLDVLPPTLPSALRELGYRTSSPWDLRKLRMDGNFPMLSGQTMAALGIEQHFEPKGDGVLARDHAIVDDALSRLASADAPRFEYLHLMHTHGPFKGPKGPERYRAAVRDADENLGRFVEGLERLDLRDGTLLFVFGDHGEGLGEHDRFGHNQTLYAEETHVPLVVSGPGVEAFVEPSPVSLTEVPALALEALGLVYPHGARGGRDAPHGRAGFVLLEYKMLDQVTQRALRSSSLAFVRWYLEDTVETFDLATDPTDRTPASPSAGQRAELLSLERAIDDWQSREIARTEALPRAD